MVWVQMHFLVEIPIIKRFYQHPVSENLHDHTAFILSNGISQLKLLFPFTLYFKDGPLCSGGMSWVFWLAEPTATKNAARATDGTTSPTRSTYSTFGGPRGYTVPVAFCCWQDKHENCDKKG
ncbi:hypothetical protein [Sphingobacterium pedocola]|uniref:Uncharacterized protein n=1 Tax=Sphingobacterium pedocola TaxID=2082722 RepID=A0ABR9TCC6_9SPHI|nr:hypothetical protein [Sphingobacterium pedocola]MBE8722719.1 hypothetical protein [Sphingobacterium pedocola]